MDRKKPSDLPQKAFENLSQYRHGNNRRSFLENAGTIAIGAFTAGSVGAWAQSQEAHPASARVLDQLRTHFTFQISVDVTTLPLGLSVASAGLKGGVNIVEMGTPLLKSEGVSNVVPAFRKQFPKALLLADMKTMDGGATEARGVYAGGGNIIDFLALAGVDTARAICAVRDEFRRTGSDTSAARLFGCYGAASGPGRAGRGCRASYARCRRGRGRRSPAIRRAARQRQAH